MNPTAESTLWGSIRKEPPPPPTPVRVRLTVAVVFQYEIKHQGERFPLGFKKGTQRTLFWTFKG